MQLQYEEDRVTRTKEDVVLRLPFVRQFPFTPQWTDEQYNDLMAEWNIYAPHEVPLHRMDPAEAAIIDLQRELISQGDDATKGVVRVRAGSDGKVAAAKEIGGNSDAAAENPDHAKRSVGVAFRIAGRDFTLPLSRQDVDALTAMADSLRTRRGESNRNYPSPFDVPGRCLPSGDLFIPVSDDERESDTKGLVLGHLAQFTDFAQARETILRALCPDSQDITIRPHRIEIYQRGDSQAKHVEPRMKPLSGTSPNGDDDDEIGNLLVHLPTAADYRDGLKRSARKDMLIRFDPDRTEGTYESGETRFYVGRSLATNDEINLDIIHNMKDIGFDRPSAKAVLETRFAVAEYSQAEISEPTGARPLNYVAWASGVCYEALPVLNRETIVLKYKVYRGKNRIVWDIPRREAIINRIHTAFHCMALRPNPITTSPAFPHDPSFLRPVHIGIVLRHTYEPKAVLAAMEQPTSLLRGLDAITYRLVSGKFESRLLPAIVYKSDCHCAAWRVQEFPHRFVFASLKGYPELKADLGDHKMSDRDALPLLVSALSNAIVNCLWAQIGNGQLLGGGGNAYDTCVCDTIPDCGTDWWYQNAVLVVTPEPARWARRKPLFSIRDRSRDRTETPQSTPRSLAGALAHWNILETVALYL
jgi:hypothetical protein